jgi:hypothetical protein
MKHIIENPRWLITAASFICLTGRLRPRAACRTIVSHFLFPARCRPSRRSRQAAARLASIPSQGRIQGQFRGIRQRDASAQASPSRTCPQQSDFVACRLQTKAPSIPFLTPAAVSFRKSRAHRTQPLGAAALLPAYKAQCSREDAAQRLQSRFRSKLVFSSPGSVRGPGPSEPCPSGDPKRFSSPIRAIPDAFQDR